MNPLPSNPAGWLLSEKLDGVFCRWNGEAFMSRHGNTFTPPDWFMEGMPPVMLDGELWTQRGGFDELVSSIQRKLDPWAGVSFQVFDMAVLRVPIEARIARLQSLALPPQAALVAHRPCLGNADLDETEAATVAAGGEGLILREAGSFYSPRNFLKVKRLFPDLDRSTLD